MRNFRRPTTYESIFKRFTDTPHPDSERPIFTTQRDFLCFLAMLGFHVGERSPLPRETLELDGRVFDTHEGSRDIVYLVALAGSRDASVLHPEREDEMITVFEEYAVTGLKRLNEWLIACPDDHIGDQAILSALKRDGFLGESKTPVNVALEKLEF
jgi:dnd system-associated protein 4